MAVPSLQAVTRGGGQAAQQAAWTGVEHAEPASLLDSELTCRGTEDPGRPRGPPAGSDLALDLVPVDAERGQLAAGEHVRLAGGEILDVRAHPRGLPSGGVGPNLGFRFSTGTPARAGSCA
ncbi:hypothetical protein GCM10009788_36210 [Nocardioides humi]|uniref:Uncharacterized protein n=1 Tax=Nocardioides humi TaxID=449461 RepID=A0ABN2AX92_9ACTN